MNTLEILDKLVAFETVSAASNLQLIAVSYTHLTLPTILLV